MGTVLALLAMWRCCQRCRAVRLLVVVVSCCRCCCFVRRQFAFCWTSKWGRGRCFWVTMARSGWWLPDSVWRKDVQTNVIYHYMIYYKWLYSTTAIGVYLIYIYILTYCQVVKLLLVRSSHTGSNVTPLFLMHLGFWKKNPVFFGNPWRECIMAYYGLGFCRKERERWGKHTRYNIQRRWWCCKSYQKKKIHPSSCCWHINKKYVGNFPMTRGPSWPNES